MPGPRPKTCAACGRDIAPEALYYRFTLVLQGEQDVIGASSVSGPEGGEEELAALMKRLEAAPDSAQEWEDQVHWERQGTVCGACREVVVRMLSTPLAVPRGPH
ncbi:MAG: hypothetical protein ABW123_04635 [Cystobacter sp.]